MATTSAPVSGINSLNVEKIVLYKNAWKSAPNNNGAGGPGSLVELQFNKDDGQIFKLRNITFTESIFNPLIQGSIIFEDMRKYFLYDPLIGDEKITMDINVDMNKDSKQVLKMEFRVTRFFPLTNDANNKTQVLYKIEFSEPCYANFLKLKSYSFGGDLLSTLVKKMSKKLLNKEIKDVNLEQTDLRLDKDDKSICFPYSTFSEKLEYINRYARGKNTKNYQFLYYSTLGNDKDPILTHYRTMSDLLDPERSMSAVKENFKYIPDIKSATLGIVEDQKVLSDSPLQFKEYVIEGAPDIVKAQKSGSLGMIGLYWDAEEKLWADGRDYNVSKEVKYDEVLKNQNHTGTALKYTSEIYKNRMIPKYYTKYHQSVPVYELENAITKANYQDSLSVSIVVPGLWMRKLGVPIWLDFMDFTTPDNQKKYMASMSGLYITKTITHIIQFPSTQYQQALSLMTTSDFIRSNENQVNLTKEKKNLTNIWRNEKLSPK
jgi:hypothetical protein